MLDKIGVVGGGNIGGVLVQEIARRGLAREIGLTDPAPFPNPKDPPEAQAVVAKRSVAKGKALDVLEGLPTIGRDVRVVGSKDYGALEGARMIINTAGVPRAARPDGSFPTREELLSINLRVTTAVAEGIRQHAPDAIVISIANPLDAIVYTLDRKLGLPKGHLMGMAGVLDSARYRTFVAQAAGVSVRDVTAMVLGGHGDTMVPVRSSCRVGGIPVERFLDAETLDAIEERTRNAGGEVVGLLGTGSAFVSPAWSALEMAEAILYDEKRVVPVSAWLDGEYGVEGLYVGVPVVLGRGGVEQVLEIDLTDAERAAFDRSVEATRKTVAEVERMLSA